MHVSLLALAGVAAAARNEYDRPDLRGSYWDVSISTQSGRPGYSIRDFSASFHTPLSTQTFEGKCHYSFVPQGTSPPAETNECSGGLKYEWDCKPSLSYLVVGNENSSIFNIEDECADTKSDTNVTLLESTVVLGNDTLWIYGLPTKIETTRRSDGMSSTTKGDGRIEISHYCIKDYGCGYADGCISTACHEEKTK